MSTIKAQLVSDVKDAMRNRDKARLGALRLIQAAFKQKEIDDRQQLSDEDCISILNKMAKQRRDSITQFERASRDDLVKQEQAELVLIEHYLPTQLSADEINQLIDQLIVTTHAQSAKDMGKLMKELKTQLKGRADLGKVSQLVKTKLAS